MKYRSVVMPLVMVFYALPLSAVYADIGGIGSPVVPSNAPAPAAGKNADKKDAVTTAAASTQEERKPLLVIRFNQNHVYFERALRQAVESTERAKPEAYYEVVSYVPASSGQSQGERATESATNNLNAVVQQMASFGVQSSRIRASMQSGADVKSQEIRIFVD